MDTNEISFVGYKVPHPLRAEMVLRVGVDFERDKARDGKQTVARAAISRAAAACALMFREWREDWMKAKTRPIGLRNRESLRLNVGNARALEEAASRVAPPREIAAPAAKRQAQRSAFYGKYVENKAARAAAPVAAAAAAPQGALPPGWQVGTAPDGRSYYYNPATGVSQWEFPAAAAPTSPLYNPASPVYAAQSP
jgi:hypothetical protein